jgi:hypothetical protein
MNGIRQLFVNTKRSDLRKESGVGFRSGLSNLTVERLWRWRGRI